MKKLLYSPGYGADEHDGNESYRFRDSGEWF